MNVNAKKKIRRTALSSPSDVMEKNQLKKKNEELPTKKAHIQYEILALCVFAGMRIEQFALFGALLEHLC